MRQIVIALSIVIVSLGCGGHQPEAKGPAKHYSVTGRVVSLNSKNQTVSLDAEAIPGYMAAMTMDYPVPSRDDFNALHVGDKVKATINVSESGDYDLSSIQKPSTGK